MYATTGRGVPSVADKAFKKCPVEKRPSLPAMHSNSAQAGNSSFPALQATINFAASSTPTTQAELVTMADAMEKSLDNVATTIAKADKRLLRLKSLVSGASNVLTSAQRKATNASETALKNRGRLLAIAMNRDSINRTFAVINRSTFRIQKLQKRIKLRIPPPGNRTGPKLSDLKVNISTIEKGLKILNDPKMSTKIYNLVSIHRNFTSDIRRTVHKVVRANIRGLAEELRVGLWNYTQALSPPHKQDPCCAGCEKAKKANKTK